MVLPSVRNGAVQSVKNCEMLRFVMIVRSLCNFLKNTYLKNRSPFKQLSLCEISNGVQGVQTRLKRKDRFESK